MTSWRWRYPRGTGALSPDQVRGFQRRRLLDAFVAVCAEHGYGATTTTLVAAEAGVSTASFYQIFADKRECMLAVCREQGERFEETLRAAWRSRPDPARAFTAAIDAALRFAAAERGATRLLWIEARVAGGAASTLREELLKRLAAALRGVRPPAAVELSLDAERFLIDSLASGLLGAEPQRSEDLVPDLAALAGALLGGAGGDEATAALTVHIPPISAHGLSQALALTQAALVPSAPQDVQRRRLFDALIDLLAEQPYGMVTVAQIAKRAGVALQHDSLARLAAALRRARPPSAADTPALTEEVRIAGAAWLLADRLRALDPERLSELSSRVSAVLLAPYGIPAAA